jgi:TusA-related sulfurtransferase
MDSNVSVLELDVKGEVCPAPLIKAMEAMKSAETGQEIDMVTDFLPAVLTVTNAALKENWNIKIEKTGTQEWKVRLSKAHEAFG